MADREAKCMICGEVKECPYFMAAPDQDHVYDKAGDLCQDCHDTYQGHPDQLRRVLSLLMQVDALWARVRRSESKE